MENTWYIRGGHLIDPLTGTENIADLFIKDGVIARLPAQIPPKTRIIEAHGMAVVPGFIDIHVHLREPGNEAAETIKSGCRAAARGGFTTIVSMPNTNPPTDSTGMISRIIRQSRKCGLARVLPSGCISKNRAGKKLADLRGMAKAGAIAFTDDGSTITDNVIMEQAMRICRKIELPIFDHALDPTLAGNGVMHKGPESKRLGLPGIPSLAESRIVERDIRLASRTRCKIHIQHISALESVKLVRKALSKGVRISAEATPHHLALTDRDVQPKNTSFKMNPPVRSGKDRKAILSAVADGAIRILATDHAPHTKKDKSKGFLSAPFGVVGLETAIGITFTLLVKSGMMSRMEWVRRWTSGPAQLLNLPAPGLGEGQPADISILDLDSKWTVRSAKFASKSKNTPFENRKLTGRAVYTFLEGRITWNAHKKK